jgi:hypothetical protein
MTAGAAAGALAFDKRAGQHFAESPEAADELAAQFQVGFVGRSQYDIYTSVRNAQSQVPEKICKNAVNLRPEGKILQTNGLALTPLPP